MGKGEKILVSGISPFPMFSKGFLPQVSQNSSLGAKCLNIIFRRGVLHMSSGIEEIGTPQWPIVLCLLCAWTMTFLALSKGVKSTGKVRE